MRPITLSFGKADKAQITTAKEYQWAEFAKLLTAKPPESQNKAARGWFIPASFADNHRDGGNFKFRDSLTLDFDKVEVGAYEKVQAALANFAHAIYTTFSHTPEAPRFRVVVPLSRSVDLVEFQALARKLAADTFGIELVARESFSASQMMYMPTVRPSKAGEFKSAVNDAPWLDVDKVLASYANWRDLTSWPHRAEHDELHPPGEQIPPDQKPGLIGKFCSAFRVADAIQRFELPYSPSGNGRWTYTAGSVAEGVVEFDDGLKFHSFHDSDPARGQCNVYDLVRKHKFGNDEASNSKMLAFVRSLPECAEVRKAEEEFEAQPITETVTPPPPLAIVNVMPEVLAQHDMEARFVHVAKGPIIVDVKNPRRMLRPGEFAAAYASCRIATQDGMKAVTTLWAQSELRKTADMLTFHPGEGQFFMQDGLRQFNTWIAPSWPRTDSLLAAPFLDHLRYLIPDQRSRDDLLDWLAHAVQRPAERPHLHFLLIAQIHGIGRSWLGDLMVRLFSDRHAGTIDLSRHIAGVFNSELSGKIITVVHEVKAPAQERFSQRERLNSLLSDSSLTVNEKHLPVWVERFCARFLMFTNRDDALPLSELDRRVYAVRCAETPRDAAYYTRLYERGKDPQFLAAVWTLLCDRDIRAFNSGMKAPLNDMKRQMIEAGRSDEQQTAVDLMKACPHPIVSAADLTKALVPPIGHESPRDRKARSAAVTAALKDIGLQTLPTKVRVVGQVTRLWALRDASAWINASTARLVEAAKLAHADFKAKGWAPDAIIQGWTDGDDSKPAAEQNYTWLETEEEAA
jgi:hypothetical protein